MKKSTVIRVFGSASRLADAIGVSKQAISLWPDELTTRQTNEVVGAMLRAGKLTDLLLTAECSSQEVSRAETCNGG